MNSILPLKAADWTLESAFGIALQATLEDYAFEEPLPLQTTEELATEQISVTIQIIEPPMGGLILSVEPSTARRLFLSISGIAGDQPIGEDSVRDAIGELANVFAGNLVREVIGTDLPFRLSLPQPGIIVAGSRQEMARFSIGLSMGEIDAFVFGALRLNCVK